MINNRKRPKQTDPIYHNCFLYAKGGSFGAIKKLLTFAGKLTSDDAAFCHRQLIKCRKCHLTLKVILYIHLFIAKKVFKVIFLVLHPVYGTIGQYEVKAALAWMKAIIFLTRWSARHSSEQVYLRRIMNYFTHRAVKASVIDSLLKCQGHLFILVKSFGMWAVLVTESKSLNCKLHSNPITTNPDTL